MSILFVLIGFVLLAGGADVMVRGAVAMARRLGVSPLVIGLTVVALGTSAPELVVSLNAALSGSADLALGNVVGSNIANVLLILGVTAVIAAIPCPKLAIRRDLGTMLGATVIFCAFALSGTIDRIAGIAMLCILVVATVFAYVTEKQDQEDLPEPGRLGRSLPLALLATVGGLGAVLLGADLFVDGATAIARALGVSEAVIGLTLVAFGTSLPELATCAAAAMRKHPEVALANVLGSNTMNLLLIAGATATVTPLAVPAGILARDLWVMAGVALLLVPIVLTGARIVRWEGALLLAGYVAYVIAVYAIG